MIKRFTILTKKNNRTLKEKMFYQRPLMLQLSSWGQVPPKVPEVNTTVLIQIRTEKKANIHLLQSSFSFFSSPVQLNSCMLFGRCYKKHVVPRCFAVAANVQSLLNVRFRSLISGSSWFPVKTKAWKRLL